MRIDPGDLRNLAAGGPTRLYAVLRPVRGYSPASDERVLAWRRQLRGIPQGRAITDLSQLQLQTALREVSSLLRMDTGWTIDLATSHVSVVDRAEALTLRVADFAASVGREPGELGRVADRLRETEVLSSASYFSGLDRLVFVRELQGSLTGDALYCALYEEGMRRAQARLFPHLYQVPEQYFPRLAETVRLSDRPDGPGLHFDTFRALLHVARSSLHPEHRAGRYLSFLEGQPNYFLERHGAIRFPEAAVEPIRDAAYADGVHVFDKIVQERPYLLDRLFSVPGALDTIFAPRRSGRQEAANHLERTKVLTFDEAIFLLNLSRTDWLHRFRTLGGLGRRTATDEFEA